MATYIGIAPTIATEITISITIAAAIAIATQIATQMRATTKTVLKICTAALIVYIPLKQEPAIAINCNNYQLQ